MVSAEWLFSFYLVAIVHKRFRYFDSLPISLKSHAQVVIIRKIIYYFLFESLHLDYKDEPLDKTVFFLDKKVFRVFDRNVS